MANVSTFDYTDTFAGLGQIQSAGAPRGISNWTNPIIIGGSTRPTEGQAWPRGNTRGNS